MSGERVPCPEGYEPVVDTVCGEPAFYVEINHNPAALLRDFKKMWPDGRPVVGWEFARCGSCGRDRLGRSYEQNGIRRDEQGVRRLW